MSNLRRVPDLSAAKQKEQYRGSARGMGRGTRQASHGKQTSTHATHSKQRREGGQLEAADADLDSRRSAGPSRCLCVVFVVSMAQCASYILAQNLQPPTIVPPTHITVSDASS